MHIVFNLLRVITGLMASGALLILMAIVLLRSSLQFAKEGIGVLAYVSRLFTSGFTQGTPPGDPAGWIVSLPQGSLALLFVAMIISLFFPGAKILLHSTAGLAAIACLWYLRMTLVGPQLEILCLPVLAAWFAYYGMCLFWARPLT